jgi:hypothetical protein
MFTQRGMVPAPADANRYCQDEHAEIEASKAQSPIAGTWKLDLSRTSFPIAPEPSC